MRQSYGRHPLPAASEIVDRETRSSGVFTCLLVCLVGVGELALIGGMIAAILLLKPSSGVIGAGMVAAVIVPTIPLIVHFARRARKVRSILERMGCPRCGGASALGVDGDTNRYQLTCDACRVVWLTDIGAPGHDDHGHHHHHHH